MNFEEVIIDNFGLLIRVVIVLVLAMDICLTYFLKKNHKNCDLKSFMINCDFGFTKVTLFKIVFAILAFDVYGPGPMRGGKLTLPLIFITLGGYHVFASLRYLNRIRK